MIREQIFWIDLSVVTETFHDDKQKLVVSCSDLHPSIKVSWNNFSKDQTVHSLRIVTSRKSLASQWFTCETGINVASENQWFRRILLYIQPTEISREEAWCNMLIHRNRKNKHVYYDMKSHNSTGSLSSKDCFLVIESE